MQAYSVFLVTQHLEQLRADAAESRRYRRATPSARVRFARALGTVRTAAAAVTTSRSATSAA